MTDQTYNAVGSTIAVTDQGQNIVNKYSYEPFGTIESQTELLPQPFKYVGQYGVMAETNGLYLMRARHYDPKVGRFISEDPIGFEGGTVNLSEYVGGNPVNYIDPEGLYTPALVGAGASGGAAAVGGSAAAGSAAAGSAIGAAIFVGAIILGTPSSIAEEPEVPSSYFAKPSISDTVAAAKERQKEYDQAKELSDTPPPPGNNDCSTLSRQIDHAQRVVKLYEAWDAKWSPGRHAKKIEGWRNRLKNLKDEHNRRCTKKCP